MAAGRLHRQARAGPGSRVPDAQRPDDGRRDAGARQPARQRATARAPLQGQQRDRPDPGPGVRRRVRAYAAGRHRRRRSSRSRSTWSPTRRNARRWRQDPTWWFRPLEANAQFRDLVGSTARSFPTSAWPSRGQHIVGIPTGRMRKGNLGTSATSCTTWLPHRNDFRHDRPRPPRPAGFARWWPTPLEA